MTHPNQPRMLAEWENPSAVLMALPHRDTDWNYILDEAIDQYRRIAGAFTRAGVDTIILCPEGADDMGIFLDSNPDHLYLIKADYNDTWVRDYGPITVEKSDTLRCLDFGFNGWGLKFASDKDNLVNLKLTNVHKLLDKKCYRNNRDFILEGGSIDTDGNGTLLTTTYCLCSPNRNGGKPKQLLVDILAQRLGADHVLWIDYGALSGDDTDSHVDTLARLAPGDTIVYCGASDDPQHPDNPGLLAMKRQLSQFRTAEGNPYNLVELPLPDPIYDENGKLLPATYANYLVLADKLFAPIYGQDKKDLLALMTLKVAFPSHEIIGIDCRTLLQQHGSLHCATMQLYPGTFKLS